MNILQKTILLSLQKIILLLETPSSFVRWLVGHIFRLTLGPMGSQISSYEYFLQWIFLIGRNFCIFAIFAIFADAQKTSLQLYSPGVFTLGITTLR